MPGLGEMWIWRRILCQNDCMLKLDDSCSDLMSGLFSHTGIQQKYNEEFFSFFDVFIVQKYFQNLSWCEESFSLQVLHLIFHCQTASCWQKMLRYFYAYRVKCSLCSDVYNLVKLIINVARCKEKKIRIWFKSKIAFATFFFFSFSFCCSYKNTCNSVTLWSNRHQPHMSKCSIKINNVHCNLCGSCNSCY